ncbi:predicted protein [Aspergillus nidulans FGSC A4]|jgi:hypothetical protein|uniref:Uncharacterized protein n=1 Tax=Emericella nidulans (strain FGSC A4 / ATCC 38163 / CBS 112.46 / NRRL 194 / M139) TaxID=227321 RepID=Q5B8S8_EMENI|nr:hypothetical protein [Aspergillus nidulans FGSC A4]EAA63623.1 predicted protein [Aspergillus nidulans FGSC A4]CBF83496.1 TPA: conserved hypothetical protein [Aspergillus nidulans FGSC A4]|eukprot:XP_660656.1 predicted protein [Aspergillus nidulans FGSC A4]
MKLDFAFLTFALASVPAANAWRVRFYQLEDGKGPQYTNAGPGGTGWRCHPNVGSLDGKVSSMRYWSDNSEHTTRCCIYLYTGQNCDGSLDKTFGHFCRNQYLNFHEWGLANKIRSYKTNCYAIDPDYAKRSADGDELELDPEFDPDFDQEFEYDDGYEVEPETSS